MCAALAAGCFFTTTVAEARFGKSGGSSGGSRSSGSSSSGSGGSHSSGSGHSGRGSGGWRSHEHGSSSGKSRVHDATPVGQDPDDSPNNGGNNGGDKGPRPRRRPILTAGVGWIPVSGAYVPYYRRNRQRPVRQEQEERSHPVMMVRMGVDAGTLKDGRTVGLHLGLEERRWGVSTRFTTLMLNTDDGSEGKDLIQLADASVTFAPFASKRGRLRWEAGVAMARAPDITFIGPSLALSFEKCLFGPFDVEGRLQWVPLPHLQLDGQAALAMHLGALTVRAGWRGLLLDDRGHLDGVVHRDKMGGPFAGVGLHF